MPTSTRASTRDRIVRAATDLLADGGRAAVSTRSVSTAAGVQPPTIYRIFGDMDGLLDAVATQAFEDYLVDKRGLGETDDPLDDLRRSWDLHVDFGLSRPMFYTLVYGGPADDRASTLRAEALERLHGMIARVAAVGRLAMSVERATALMHANGIGLVLSQIVVPPADRDPELPAIAREATIRTITSGKIPGRKDIQSQATRLRVALGNQSETPLSPTEQALLDDWLRRLADDN